MLRAKSDTVIAISNDRLLDFIDEEISLDISFRIADEVLRQGVQGVAELVTSTGLINLNLMHVKTVLHNAGSALMSIGQARGDGRAIAAAELAIASPFTELSSIAGASAILVNITGGSELSLDDIEKAVSTVAGAASPDADILFGATVDPNMAGQVQVMLIAVGMDGQGLAPRQGAAVSAPHLSDWAPRQRFASGRSEVLGVDHDHQGVDLSDLDIPTFLRRRRSAWTGVDEHDKAS
jgi:cell division protein FtsZ